MPQPGFYEFVRQETVVVMLCKFLNFAPLYFTKVNSLMLNLTLDVKSKKSSAIRKDNSCDDSVAFKRKKGEIDENLSFVETMERCTYENPVSIPRILGGA